MVMTNKYTADLTRVNVLTRLIQRLILLRELMGHYHLNWHVAFMVFYAVIKVMLGRYSKSFNSVVYCSLSYKQLLNQPVQQYALL